MVIGCQTLVEPDAPWMHNSAVYGGAIWAYGGGGTFSADFEYNNATFGAAVGAANSLTTLYVTASTCEYNGATGGGSPCFFDNNADAQCCHARVYSYGTTTNEAPYGLDQQTAGSP